MTMDAKASERTGMELYLSPFRPKDGLSAMDRSHDMTEITGQWHLFF